MRTVKEYITSIEDKVIEIKEIVNNLQVDLSEIKQGISFLKDAQAGNWEITDDQMIFYALDGSELMRFDLYNRNGQKTSRNVVKRIKV